jgi:N-acetylneuraminic acid mutarotase
MNNTKGVDGENTIMLEKLPDGPVAVQGHTFVSYKGNFYLFGGRVNPISKDVRRSYMSDLWMYIPTETNPWDLLWCENHPDARHNHSAVVYLDSMYVFGGSGDNGFNCPFIRFDFIKNTWDDVVCENLPPMRHGHTCSVFNDKMYLFGGHFTDFDGKRSTRTFFNDLHSYDISKSVWKEIQYGGDIPIGRSWHSATVLNESLVIFGGFRMEDRREEYFNDLFIFDFHSEKMQRFEVKSIVARNRHSSCVVGDNRIVIIGGNYLQFHQDVFLNDSFVVTIDTKSTYKVTCQKCVTRVILPKLSNHAVVSYKGGFLMYGGEIDRMRNSHLYYCHVEK